MTCVLVVEDDPWIQWMIADDLADRGHNVLTARDGKEALGRLRNSRPDVIVLDLMLPRLNGWEFLERYQAVTGGSAIPIVVVSAVRNPDLPAVSNEVVTCLPKPFDVEQLAGSVSHASEHADALVDRRPEVRA
jgi:two-component system, sensor histidine kinase and response regulator